MSAGIVVEAVVGRELGSSWFGFGVKYVADMIVKAGGGKYEGNILNIPPTPTLPNPFHIIVIVVITTTKRSLSRHRHVITTHMSRLPVGFARNDNRRRRREPVCTSAAHHNTPLQLYRLPQVFGTPPSIRTAS